MSLSLDSEESKTARTNYVPVVSWVREERRGEERRGEEMNKIFQNFKN
ncbi:MAG: hypothetical protein LBP36_01480 [Oscillospiraceae bacterium]|jgi:hypothetical protein|nr:hypothetical protein [Oscillospiraceae bacterium]